MEIKAKICNFTLKNKDIKTSKKLEHFKFVLRTSHFVPVPNSQLKMALSQLNAISPIDGRYYAQTSVLSNYFSEFSLTKHRLEVEIEYFITLCDTLPQLKNLKNSFKNHFEDNSENNSENDDFKVLRNIYKNFSEDNALKIKEIEKITNHDIKAVEYYLKDCFKEIKIKNIQLSDYQEFIHFALTSQDINNTAIPLALARAMAQVMLPILDKIVVILEEKAVLWQNTPMLARTHGQAATPTSVGKELLVFVERLDYQISMLKKIPFSAKFGGATGNFNAHIVAYPHIDWVSFADNFVENILGNNQTGKQNQQENQEKISLKRSKYTTQIEHYDNLAALSDNFRRINIILTDFCRDIWQYISMNYFTQKIKENEVGSSAMPHKVNPIDFENAEGNLGMANAIFSHFSEKLPISRLQRDLTDSTVLRNLGVPLAHSLIAYNSILKGINKLELNESTIFADLEDNWAVISEGIQTILRREGFAKPYEIMKNLTRKNEKITQKIMQDFIRNLEISEELKNELLQISPFNYLGIKEL